ncbi:MAG TPA: hypothetical protein VM598_11055 [Bdellovibrionota bacterium]|nr:hypothetical protein [Bdellovibrionota bacterium]
MSFVKEVLAEGIFVYTGAQLFRLTGNDRRTVKAIAAARARACMGAGIFLWLGIASLAVILIWR